MSSKTFEDKLDSAFAVFANYDNPYDSIEAWEEMQIKRILESKQAIIKLIEEDVIGENHPVPRYLKDWSRRDSEEYWFNLHRAEQRKVIRGDIHE